MLITTDKGWDLVKVFGVFAAEEEVTEDDEETDAEPDDSREPENDGDGTRSMFRMKWTVLFSLQQPNLIVLSSIFQKRRESSLSAVLVSL